MKLVGNIKCGSEDDREHIPIGYCESCGLAIYGGEEALTVVQSGDIIHPNCWDYYADEHKDLFTVQTETDRRYYS